MGLRTARTVDRLVDSAPPGQVTQSLQTIFAGFQDGLGTEFECALATPWMGVYGEDPRSAKRTIDDAPSPTGPRPVISRVS